MFKGVIDNETWGINQILDAGAIDEVFRNLYSETKGNVVSHSEIWVEFISSIKAKGFEYKSLNALLIDDGYIKAEPEKEKEVADAEI